MPKLIKLYEEHADKRDKFEIIAFHDETLKTMAELDKTIEEKGFVEKRWGGKNLPFPVLMSGEGGEVRNLGVRVFPTMILINPEGKLVKTGASDRDLLAAIGIEVPAPKPAAKPAEGDKPVEAPAAPAKTAAGKPDAPKAESTH